MKSTNISRCLISIFCFFFIASYHVSATPIWPNIHNETNQNSALFSNLTGNVWIESDGNTTYNGEAGPSGVLVLLYDNEEDTIIAQSFTSSGKYEFNSIPEGKYYLKIDQSAFEFGGSLFGQQSCIGVNDANDMVDDDDNGSDSTPNDVFCSPFNLTNSDSMSNVSIEYIDFCFFSSCEEPNPLAFPSCEEVMSADIICDISGLDNLCALMPTDSSSGNQPSPLCDGFNSSENISWLAFTAADGNYSINITPMDCQFGNLGQEGLQVGIYTDCTFEENVFCSDICTTNPISIGGSLLNPGQVYYLYINGCNGNVCRYQIDINGSPSIPSLEPADVCIFSNGVFQCEDISYCTNDDILFQGLGLSLFGEYSWTISTISGANYFGDSIVITNQNLLTINIPSEGKYEVCLTNVENDCPDQAWSGEVCREVTTSFAIPMPMDEDFGDFFVCDGEFTDFTVNEFAAADPNGDGDSGWNAPIPEYMIGINKGTASIEGCSYDQQFTLSEFLPSPVEDVLISVCEEDLPIQIDALTITTFSFQGPLPFVLENYLLVNSQDMNGCDSIINLTVEKLIILLGAVLEPNCTADGINLEFEYIADLSVDIAFLDFVWTDPLGNILSFGTDPLTVTAPFESGSGEYTLDININKNGASCTFSYSTFVDIQSFLPPPPVVTGPSIVCSNEGISVYTAEGQGDEIQFIWSFPNDVASAIISGNTITIDWTGSNGGEVIAVGQNTCGLSEQTSLDVQVIPLTTPNFIIDTSICVDNPASIIFNGSNFNIIDYSWDFDGGTIISGSGIGPYEVSWGDSGEKFVSLFTTDANGCISNTTVQSILVQAPLVPTNVACIASIGQVIFTWEIPPMVIGFEVNVLSGQTGGVFAANSFTVSGLMEGEVVTIELLTKPEDPICGDFVSTIATCVAEDCTPPTIELEADQSLCVDDATTAIMATITTGETGTGIFTGPGIIDALAGIFDPQEANIGINTILYTFTSDVADCVGSKTISIEVFEKPIASFTQDQDTICITSILSLDYTGTPNAESFDWDFDGGVGSGLLTNQEVVFNTSGEKTISLQVTKEGCTSNIFSSTVFVEPEIEEITIECDTAATDFVIFSWNTLNGVSLFEITIDNNPSFFSPNTTLTVDGLDEDQEVSITVSALSNTTCPGTTASDFCKTTKTPVSAEHQALTEIKVFPNPAQDLIFFEGSMGLKISYTLYSILGTKLMSGFPSSKTINIASLPSGLYVLRIVDNQTNLYRDFKVMKQ